MNIATAFDTARFFGYVQVTSGCWFWLGAQSKTGHGVFWLEDKVTTAHRAGYLLLLGELPAESHLHHLCGSKLCVRPDHLQVVTPSEHCGITRPHTNRKLANQNKTHCPRGHEYTPENTWTSKKGERLCKQCNHERGFERRRRLGETPGKGRHWFEKSKTHCPAGHEYTAENTYMHPKGSRICRTCKRERDARARQKEPEL